MAKAMVGSWPTTALLAIGLFVTSAMAEDAPSPSADAPRSDQRRLRILLSAGPVLWIETGAQVGGALSFRTGTHTAAFVAIDKGPSDEVTSRLGFRFVTRPDSSVTPYFSFAYARVSDDVGRSWRSSGTRDGQRVGHRIRHSRPYTRIRRRAGHLAREQRRRRPRSRCGDARRERRVAVDAPSGRGAARDGIASRRGPGL